MWTRRSLSGLALGVAAAGSAGAQATGQPAPAGSQARDAAALRAFAETTHPRGHETAADAGWAEGWNDLIVRADGLEPATYVMALKARLAWFKDGHTTIPIGAITIPGFGLRLPIGSKPLDDGLFVSSAKDEGLPLLGSRITAVEGVPLVEFARKFIDQWPGDNPGWGHHDLGLAMFPGVMRGAGMTPARSLDAPITVEGERDGVRISALLTPRADGAQGRQPLPRPTATVETLRPEGARNFARPLEDGRTLFIAFDSLGEDLQATLAFVRDCFAKMEEPAVQRVVLDLRRNGGGNNFFGEGLRKQLERSRFNRPGGLYVLIAPQTFSAAQNLANRLERETYAVFVGQPTGGAPNHYGDSGSFTGLGYTASVSTLPWFDSYPQDRRRWIMPDILTPDVFADWSTGRDPTLDAALAHSTTEAPNDLSRDRTFPYERASQSAVWAPFWA